MAEIYPQDDVIRLLKDFPPLQRVLLAQSGTLQSTLAAFFARPVLVRVLTQEHVQGTGRWTRKVSLYFVEDGGEIVACEANSEVVVGPRDAQGLIKEEGLGLGQIMEALGIRPKFTLSEVGRNATHFWRLYILDGGDITYQIREDFPMHLY